VECCFFVDIPGIGIDQDRTWRFLPVVLNDLTLIGEWNPRLFIGWVRQRRCGNFDVETRPPLFYRAAMP